MTTQDNIVRIAVAQTPSRLGELTHNAGFIAEAMGNAARQGAQLVVFPECALSGYMFDSRKAVAAASVPVDDPVLSPIYAAARHHGVHAVVGLLEYDAGKLYNSAIFVGPTGLLGNYRKQHLPLLGADRFLDPGDIAGDRVVDIGFMRVGIMICFDLRYPESARELALDGADVIAMPTNWPLTATFLANHMTRVRAVENLVYMAVADRADSEAGTPFLGHSQIISPTGDVLAHAGTQETIVFADIDVTVARQKQLVFTTPPYELPVFDARRPELYGVLIRRT
ncbi:Predicted amidohydrolase [Pseudomonas gessardii]|uniref:carbon-nitrogen hydrolase family protein n=1 Tax=Pseudomonas gessardii TaxID=78544 RepID=UPI000881B4FB|nr:carbon-nitrogen hydrolase family protein [Pseudomonas gessardii]MRU52417.1 carbon-nitrogen hydrolase family protein [Pseudomonas gessardii]ONH39761.1 hypothetical protein BLL38_18680 [Pseudomonas gessardii]SDQ72209.1 Predicted amidohydrolase [Pseudomonas gessardii]